MGKSIIIFLASFVFIYLSGRQRDFLKLRVAAEDNLVPLPGPVRKDKKIALGRRAGCAKDTRLELAILLDDSSSFRHFAIRARRWLPQLVHDIQRGYKDAAVSVSRFCDRPLSEASTPATARPLQRAEPEKLKNPSLKKPPQSPKDDKCFTGLLPLSRDLPMVREAIASYDPQVSGCSGGDHPEDALNAMTFAAASYAQFSRPGAKDGSADEDANSDSGARVERILLTLTDDTSHSGRRTINYDHGSGKKNIVCGGCQVSCMSDEKKMAEYPCVASAGESMRRHRVTPFLLVSNETVKGRPTPYMDPFLTWQKTLLPAMGLAPNSSGSFIEPLSFEAEDGTLVELVMSRLRQRVCETPLRRKTLAWYKILAIVLGVLGALAGLALLVFFYAPYRLWNMSTFLEPLESQLTHRTRQTRLSSYGSL